jgi:hypothetical protein
VTRDKLLLALRVAVRETEINPNDTSMTMARLHALLSGRPTMLATIVREISRVEKCVRTTQVQKLRRDILSDLAR